MDIFKAVCHFLSHKYHVQTKGTQAVEHQTRSSALLIDNHLHSLIGHRRQDRSDFLTVTVSLYPVMNSSVPVVLLKHFSVIRLNIPKRKECVSQSAQHTNYTQNHEQVLAEIVNRFKRQRVNVAAAFASLPIRERRHYVINCCTQRAQPQQGNYIRVSV